MKSKILIKNFGFLILLALVPFLLILKFKWNGIIPLIIYFQVLLIWIQVEIGFRQHTLFSVQFDPFFDVKMVEGNNIYLRNISKNAGYNLAVGRILDENRNPISPRRWQNKIKLQFISSLAPDERKLICSIDEEFIEELIRNNSTIHIVYTDVFGEFREFYIKILEDKEVWIMPERKFPPGILLNLLEHFSLQFKFLRLKKYIKGAKKDLLL